MDRLADDSDSEAARGRAPGRGRILGAIAWADTVIVAMSRELGAAVAEGLAAHGVALCGRVPDHSQGEDAWR